MTTVIRAGSDEATDAQVSGRYVYIGRPSKWGNPFKIGHQMPREAAIRAYKTWFHQPEQEGLRAAALAELTDKALGCYCFPRSCHGDVLAEFVNHAGPKPTLQ